MSESTVKPGTRVAMTAALLVAVLLGGQALAGATAPPGGTASTGRLLGKASGAYLGGLRTFTAAVLWNRLEPLYHGYYGGRTVDKLVEFLPTMRLVQLLDPQFEQSYYNSTYILSRLGKMDDALSFAREGIRNNPQSGLLLANYAQLLMIKDKKGNLPEMVALADRGIKPGINWASIDDEFEGYGIFRTVYKLAGDQKTSDAVDRAQKALGQQGAGLGVERDEAPPGGGK